MELAVKYTKEELETLREALTLGIAYCPVGKSVENMQVMLKKVIALHSLSK